MTPLNDAMRLLASKGALFIGQGVAYDGVSMYHDLDGVPAEQRLEFPVAEELQLGFCTGLAMQGHLPVSIFPRIDFLLRAADQLVNHLDKLERMSRGQWNPKVIIRTRVGPKEPLNAGPQHTANYCAAFRKMLTSVEVCEIRSPEGIIPTYQYALNWPRSVMVVENLG